MIRLVQPTSFNRFEAIKREIQQDLTIFKFPGQSVKDLASAFISKAKELENFGMYEHRLTLIMLDRFLEGGGTSYDMPPKCIATRYLIFKQDSTPHFSSLDHTTVNAHMPAEGLTYRQVCNVAEEGWKRLSDDNKWALSKVKSDSSTAPSQFGANSLECLPSGAPLTEATALALIQQGQEMLAMQRIGGTNGDRPGTCHN
jgi:hypothetical protein